MEEKGRGTRLSAAEEVVFLLHALLYPSPRQRCATAARLCSAADGRGGGGDFWRSSGEAPPETAALEGAAQQL
uniref:Uncharacterized protein n=1 Tax=Oryza rufipogon TaxID=4529 RepID=A0A0E0Q3M1_ORYRU